MTPSTRYAALDVHPEAPGATVRNAERITRRPIPSEEAKAMQESEGVRSTPADPAAGRESAAGGEAPGVLDRALALVGHLRAHCPWDRAQTPQSLVPYLLEEAAEVADAIAAHDDHALEAEIGDLLLHVAFQIVLAEERAAFHRESAVARLERKMRERHPHVYGGGEAVAWESLKARAREQEGAGILDGLTRRIDPLLRAHRIQERVSGVGFDWESAEGAWRKVAEELEEVRAALERAAAAQEQTHGSPAAGAAPGAALSAGTEQFSGALPRAGAPGEAVAGGAPEDAAAVRAAASGTDGTQGGGGEPAPELVEELGDLLFAVVNLTRLSGVHALAALQRANAKFQSRFEALERLARDRGIRLGEAPLEVLDALWDEVKAPE